MATSQQSGSLRQAQLTMYCACYTGVKLRLVASSGEPLTVDLLDRVHAVLPRATVLNIYGCTEVAADVTCYEARAASRHWSEMSKSAGTSDSSGVQAASAPRSR